MPSLLTSVIFNTLFHVICLIFILTSCLYGLSLTALSLSTVPESVLSFTVTQTGSPVAGNEFSVTCEVTKTVAGLINSPTAMWTAQGSGIQVTSPSTGVSILTFSSLKTMQGGTYICEGSLLSPALASPLILEQREIINVQSEYTVSCMI